MPASEGIDDLRMMEAIYRAAATGAMAELAASGPPAREVGGVAAQDRASSAV